ncbi:MAG: methyl-accepting chemotaxis protein [Pseudomonas sp.]|nr:methyl-accepting chemotaxis protein [Pseudomonas sp.]MDP3848134.1 methyl-accepting chemotaxis protein [Pseudomonas sp.]
MQWFTDLRIAYKTAIVPLVLCILLVVLGLVSTSSLRSVASGVDVVTQDLGPSMDNLAQITDAMARLQLSVRHYARSADQGSEQQFSELDQRLNLALQQADKRIQDPQRRQLLAEIGRLHGEYSRLFREQLVPISQQRQQLMVSQLDVHGPAVEKILSSVLENAQQDFNLDAVFYASAGMRNLLLGSQYLYQFLQENQPEQVKAFQRELGNAQNVITVLRDRTSSDSSKAKLNQALQTLDLYKAAASKLVLLVQARNDAVSAMDKLDPQIADLAQQLQQHIMQAMQDAARAANATVISVSQLFWGLVLAAILFGGLLAYGVGSALVRALGQINRMLQDMAQGEGDLTKRLPVHGKDDLGRLALSFNTFVEKIRRTVASVAQASHTLESAAQVLQLNAKAAAADVEQQRHESAQIAVAMSQVAASAAQVADTAQLAAKLSLDARQSADLGLSRVQSNNASMLSLTEKVNKLAGVIESLRSDSSRIDSVLEVIRSIAEQTNLLALNAAIEAARAGDQGRGFAVVADEVRSLAQRTQHSTKEIHQIIQALQQRTLAAIEMMADSQTAVSHASASTEQTSESLQAITSAVDAIDSNIQSMARAASEQARVATAVGVGLARANSISEHTVSTVAQTRAAASSILELDSQLSRLIEQFQT